MLSLDFNNQLRAIQFSIYNTSKLFIFPKADHTVYTFEGFSTSIFQLGKPFKTTFFDLHFEVNLCQSKWKQELIHYFPAPKRFFFPSKTALHSFFSVHKQLDNKAENEEGKILCTNV